MITRKKKIQDESLPIRKRYVIRFLKPEHIEFLTNPQIINDWAAHPLKHRCVLFHRKFPDHRINPTLLTRIYKMHKVK